MINFFLKRSVVINLLSIFFIVIGGYLFITVKREAFPEITFDIVNVSAVYPGASPEEVERLVTNPIEDELRTVDGIDKVESYSLESRCQIVVRLDEDLSDDEVSRTVLYIDQAVARVKDLPDEVEDPVVQELTSDRPLITLTIAGGNALSRDKFAEELKDALEDIDGVARVLATGDAPKEIWVEAELRKLQDRRVTLGEIAGTLRERNLNLPAGTAPDKDRELMVRTVGALNTAEDVASVILRGNDARNYLRVGDVARVYETFKKEDILPRANGLPAIHLQVFKLKKGDTITLAGTVKDLRKEFEPRAAKLDIQLLVSDDISFFISRRLNVMKNNMMIGGISILLVLFLFLEWRVAMAAAWGVPIAFVAAMSIAIPAGFTINLLTLLALIIVLGLLNDDAVVVAENIYRHTEKGEPPEVAAEKGAKEVVMPVIAGVATTMAAFIPFGMVSGIMGKFLFMIPVTVILCLAASLMESFWILPSHALDLLKVGKKLRRGSGRWYEIMSEKYRKLLGWFIDNRYKFLALAMVVTVVTVMVGVARIKIVMFPEGLIDQFFVQVETPRGTSVEGTKKVFKEIEKIIMTLPPEHLNSVTGSVGESGFEESLRRGTHLAQARVFLVPQENRKKQTNDIIDELRPRFENVKGIARLIIEKVRPGPPTGKAVQVRIRGREMSVLQQISNEIKQELHSMPGVSDIRDSMEGGKEELQVKLRPEEAAYARLDTTRIARELLYAFDGGEATEISRDRDKIKVRVKLSPEDEKRPDLIKQLSVLNAEGRQIRLGTVVKEERREGPAYFEHYNYRRSLTIFAGVDNEKSTSYQANQALITKFEDIPERYPGYELIYGGEEEQTRESMLSLRRAMIVALLLDFVILAGLFASYIQPFLIMLTIPIGLVGITWALILHDMPASFMALLGIVAMTGVVVNNAVLLVDFINIRRNEGASLKEAVIDAGVRRLRPIWASSLTTLAALFPTAYGLGGYEPFVQPMTLSLAWGLAFATPLTLFFIPMFYLILDDTLAWMRRVIFRKV